MLVLSRKEGEQLVIDEHIVITVNRISGHRVSIGIQAPSDVRISRGELQPHANDASGCVVGAGI
jgi:carbon storage regulator